MAVDNEPSVTGPDGTPITEEEHQRLHYQAVYCAPPPEGATAQLVQFLTHGHELTHYIGLPLRLADKLDETLRLMLATFAKVEEEWTAKDSGLIDYAEVARHYVPLSRGLVATRIVDNFLTCVSQTVAAIFVAKPETMRTTEQVSIEFVLSYRSMDDLVQALAEERVNRLAYKGMKELHADLEKRLGLTLFPEQGDLARAIEGIEIRNLIVHSGGVISKAAELYSKAALATASDPIARSRRDAEERSASR